MIRILFSLLLLSAYSPSSWSEELSVFSELSLPDGTKTSLGELVQELNLSLIEFSSEIESNHPIKAENFFEEYMTALERNNPAFKGQFRKYIFPQLLLNLFSYTQNQALKDLYNTFFFVVEINKKHKLELPTNFSNMKDDIIIQSIFFRAEKQLINNSNIDSYVDRLSKDFSKQQAFLGSLAVYQALFSTSIDFEQKEKAGFLFSGLLRKYLREFNLKKENYEELFRLNSSVAEPEFFQFYLDAGMDFNEPIFQQTSLLCFNVFNSIEKFVKIPDLELKEALNNFYFMISFGGSLDSLCLDRSLKVLIQEKQYASTLPREKLIIDEILKTQNTNQQQRTLK
ncbi:MAG: hypothetical protein AB8E15_04620 [Bdellovibrionales bacterium]